MSFDQITKSKYFNGVLLGIPGVIILLGVFRLGIAVGYRKASFSFGWGKHYQDNFGGPPRDLPRPFNMPFDGPSGMRDRGYIDAHGAFGSVLKIENNVIVMKGNENIEKNVTVSDKTEIIKQREPILLKDLKAGDEIMVIGSPNDKGRIDAKFIRVFKSK